MELFTASPPAPSPPGEGGTDPRLGGDDKEEDDQQKLIKHVHELSYQLKFRPGGYFEK
jgi:hypothetical protein